MRAYLPINKSLVLIVAIAIVALAGFSVFAKEFSYTATELPSPSPTSTQFSLLERITVAKQLLQISAPLVVDQKKLGKIKKQVVRKQIALVVLDQISGQLSEHRFWVQETAIKNYAKTHTLTLQPVIGNETLIPQVKWWNSFNSYYEFPNHPELVVVANKYPLLTSTIPDPAQRSRKEYTDIIYVPYSEPLQTRELVQAGKQYIGQQVDQAFTVLQANTVQSRSVPGQLVTDVVSKDFIKNIILVEHVDPDGFALSDDGGKNLTDRVLTIIGANQSAAYAYTGSPAGANGIAQFISSTYRTMRLTYPTAHLIPDFLLGTATHNNAIKAMALFFDAYKADIQKKVVDKPVLVQLGGVTEEMLSAAYNGGPNRVVKSVNNYGPNWLNGQLTATVTKVFRPETLAYLNKFQAIRDLHVF